MTITALPAAPSRTDPTNFPTEADAWVAALATFTTEANALAVAMNLNDTTSTSTTSLLIEVASKSLTVDISKSYQPGMSVKIARTASPSNWMLGDVTSYNSGTGALVVNVTHILGSGTYTDWTITLSAPIVSFGGSLVVETTASHAASASELSGDTAYTSSYAGETTITLLAGANGYKFRGDVTVAQYLKFVADGTEKFRYLNLQSAGGGYIRSNVVGNIIQCEWSGTEWVVTNIGGSWNYDA